ncbi:Putative MCP chaperone [Pacmanvirus A23]|uniref:Putative MCP chaperone n=1 Tax=Pacmanvirus A23 TaxID=1932881 RepID=UPI000A0939F8|nr:Putative MCP chaperone [Pacmanvirus A23]SIP85911.1 Putative MCP chaperone [Pacmanvirus A23]
MSLSTEELRKLADKITENPDEVYELDPEKVIELRKYLNPLGNVITSKKSYANLSLINWHEKYLRRFHMTGLVGYLYRTVEEYEPEDELQREKARFETCLKNVTDAAEIKRLTEEHNSRNKLIKSTVQSMIKKYLNRNFDYNPDNHLRGSHSENKADPERKPRDEAIRDACMIAEKSARSESVLRTKQEQTYTYLREQLLTTYQTAVDTSATLKKIISVIIDPEVDLADKQSILFKKYKQLNDTVVDMRKFVEPIATADTLSAWTVDPPVDVFHQFDRYLTNHYEQLRDVVQALYNEKPDFEYAVIYYDSFKTPESAREYRIQHENEFRTEVITVENSAVTLLGPFKENRQRVDFYNKNTEVMKRMMEQLESDHKLGKDLMEKQVKAKKKKNIEEAGPDDPALNAYAKTMNVVRELGAKKVLTREDTDALAKAQAEAASIKQDYEVPEDSIQVDMFFPEQSEDGSTKLKKTKFFTQAEAPLHMQEGSQFNETYQPKRNDNESLDSAYKRKVITGRNGQKREITVLKSD